MVEEVKIQVNIGDNMGEEILKKINNNNYKIVNELIDLITEENIKSEEELKEYQDNLFKIDGKLMNHEEEIDYCVKTILSTPASEGLFFLDMQEVINFKENVNSLSIEEKNKRVIIIYSLMNLDMMLPYDAYKLIMSNNL